MTGQSVSRSYRDGLSEMNESHALIYSALVAGHAEQAQNEMRDHIRAAYNSLLDEMRQPPAMNGEK